MTSMCFISSDCEITKLSGFVTEAKHSAYNFRLE